jgi:hypothetical protein
MAAEIGAEPVHSSPIAGRATADHQHPRGGAPGHVTAAEPRQRPALLHCHPGQGALRLGDFHHRHRGGSRRHARHPSHPHLSGPPGCRASQLRRNDQSHVRRVKAWSVSFHNLSCSASLCRSRKRSNAPQDAHAAHPIDQGGFFDLARDAVKVALEHPDRERQVGDEERSQAIDQMVIGQKQVQRDRQHHPREGRNQWPSG